MKKKKLKPFVLPTLYILIITVTCASVMLINKSLNAVDYDYSESIMKEEETSVTNDNVTKNNVFLKPYVGENVSLSTKYYSKDADEESQENALLYYEKTYMPSTGAIYTSDNEFQVVATYDGKVKSITEDNLLGTVVEIVHNNNLSSFYYSIKDVQVKEGDQVMAGTVLGTATTNKIVSDKNNILFEVYYQGIALNPEEFYVMNPNDMQ